MDDVEKKASPDAAAAPEKVDIETVCDLDDAEIFLRDNNFSPEYVQGLVADEARNKRLVRKVDLVVLPLLAGTYMLQYIDKQALSYAAVFDLFTDTGITQNQYSYFASIFYIAYLVAEYPWSFLAQRTRMAKVLGACIVAWGIVLMCTAAGGNFASLAACRFLLGLFEAPVTPCFMMIVAMWLVIFFFFLLSSLSLRLLVGDKTGKKTNKRIGTQETSNRSEPASSTAAMESGL